MDPMDLTNLKSSDTFPLTCTRLGTCCHGHRIYISAFELARLAMAMNTTSKMVRDSHLEDGGRLIRFDGPIGQHGPPAHRKPACKFYSAANGCRVHEHRPLACRLYPLGRHRVEGITGYYHPTKALPCLSLCPDVTALPNKTVGEYLQEQHVTEHEIAHDGYAALAYGMINAAVVITKHSGWSLTELATYFAEVRVLDGDTLAKKLTPTWVDALTAPELDAALPAADFVAQHGQALATRFQTVFLADPAADALTRAAKTYLLLALYLSVAVGADPDVMATIINPITSPTTNSPTT
jgi:uncharacterized protein